MLSLNLILFGALFAYGMYTMQRNGFLLDFMPSFWKKYVPKSLHEPFFSCGVCVSSVWGSFFLVSYRIIDSLGSDYRWLLLIPFYIVAMCGITAIIDRAIKYFEYGYKYTQIKPLSNYSYLENQGFRDNFIHSVLQDIGNDLTVVEIGGFTQKIYRLFRERYRSFDKASNNPGINDVTQTYISGKYFVIVKGIAFEGNFNYLLDLLESASGFIIEGSLAGDSGKQIQWIIDRFPGLIKLPYFLNDDICAMPEHCGGDVTQRVVLVKKTNTQSPYHE